MQLATGTYGGDGNDNRSIVVGFQPDLVIVVGDIADWKMWYTSTMAADESFQPASTNGIRTNRIQAMEANGFQVGSDSEVNSNGNTYHWIAVKVAGATDFAVGTYAGNGIDNRSIGGIGFQPTIVMVQREGASTAAWRVAENAGDDSLVFLAQVNQTDEIQALEADGFQVGQSNRVNNGASNYHWAAWKDATGFIETGTYTGDGNDLRDIAVGFQPTVVLVKGDLAEAGYVYTDTMAADDSSPWTQGALVANHIQALEATNFEVGTADPVNKNLDTFYWAALNTGTTSTGVPAHMMHYMRMRNG